MTIEQAIKKAIEGGYCYAISGEAYKNTLAEKGEKEIVFLDPKFWQCLGKAMGWTKGYETKEMRGESYYLKWLFEWHKFIDYLAEGKSAEDFFIDLEANKKE